jgi:hypothetical protein
MAMAGSDLRLNAWLRTKPVTERSETSIMNRGEDLFQTTVLIWAHGR